MLDYHENKLIDECLKTFYATYFLTLDTADFCPTTSNHLIFDFIDKSMKKKFREIKRENRRYKKTLKKLIRAGKIIDTTSSEFVLADHSTMVRGSLLKPNIVPNSSNAVADVVKSAVATTDDPNPATKENETISTVVKENNKGENEIEKNERQSENSKETDSGK